MKKIKYFGLTIFGLSALMVFLNVGNAMAQRPSRGGASGSSVAPSHARVAPSRSPSRISQPSSTSISRSPNYRTAPHGVRPSRSSYQYNGRPNYQTNNIYRYGYRPNYHYHTNGYNNRVYYGYYNHYRPFIGFRLNVLPYGYYPFYFGSNQYYFSDGLFYRQYENNYQVVVPPVGATVQSLPSQANLVTIDGVDYYEYKGVYYTKSLDADGKSAYIVAGKNGVLNTTDGPVDTHQIGDIINQLPEGSREVVIKNERYFVSPDEVYYEEVIDGANVSYRVIGKL